MLGIMKMRALPTESVPAPFEKMPCHYDSVSAFRFPFLVDVMSLSSRGQKPLVFVLYVCRAFMSTLVRHMGHLPFVAATLRD